MTDVFRKDGRSVPVFNDKHLSWKWEWAKEMFDISRELDFAFAAGSSLPVTWRMPAIDMPYGAEVEELLGVSIGSVDSYDFHALEMIQCMAERRRGGETGVVSMQALRGDAVWKAMNAVSWSDGGWDPRLFEACLSRSQTLAQPETFSETDLALLALAGSYPFLDMVAVMAAGGLMARQHDVARTRLAHGEGDPAFLKAKVATTRFFLDRIVPEALGKAASATAGAAGLYTLSAEELAA